MNNEAEYTSVWFTDKDKALLCAIGVVTGYKIELITDKLDGYMDKYQVRIKKEREKEPNND